MGFGLVLGRLPAQCGAQCGLRSQDREIKTWAESRRWTLTQLRYPDAPVMVFYKRVYHIENKRQNNSYFIFLVLFNFFLYLSLVLWLLNVPIYLFIFLNKFLIWAWNYLKFCWPFRNRIFRICSIKNKKTQGRGRDQNAKSGI